MSSTCWLKPGVSVVHRLSAARDQSRPTSHSLQTLPTFKGSYLHTQEGCHHISTYFMNLHCFFYTPVKTRSLYRSSLKCSNGSKSTYSTQLTKIAQLQRLIAPKPRGVSPPQMLPKRSSNASALVQSKSQVRRPLRYGATGVQSHPILVTVVRADFGLPLLPSEGQPLILNVLLQHYFTPTLKIPRQFCLLVLRG